MNCLFDNNLSPHLAHAIQELSKKEQGVEVIHLRDRFAPTTPDVEWIAALPGSWVMVSIDRFNKHHDAERAALRRAGHIVFVLDRQWSEHQYWLVAERLVAWWPRILDQARLVANGAFRVPWRFTSRSRFDIIRL